MALTVGTPISIKGKQGSPGISFLVAPGAPTGTGVEGQGYIDSTAIDLYTFTNGQWQKVRNLVGPIGMNGIDGSFFTGTGAPTTATFNGPGEAIYIQTTGEVWTFNDPSTGWVDSGENLVGPKGDKGDAGQRGTQIYHGNGAFVPANYPNAAVGDMYFDDDASTYAFITNA